MNTDEHRLLTGSESFGSGANLCNLRNLRIEVEQEES